MKWLKENLLEFASILCYCKLEEEVDTELADINVPGLTNMFKTFTI
jgi:hypothetical protein